MPVLAAMEPVLHAQYATGAGGGFPPSGGAPTSNVTDPGQLLKEPNPLIADEYDQALLRAMKLAGLNPGSFNPNVAKIMAKGPQLVQELLAEIGKPGGNAQMALSAPDLLNMLANLMRSAITGGKVFGGAGKESALQNLMNLVNAGAQSGTGDLALNFLGQLMSDPKSAMNLFSEVRYGNLAEPFQRVGMKGLMSILSDFYDKERQNPSQQPNFLATLLGGPSASSLGAGGGLPSGLGGGVPGATGQPGSAAGPVDPTAAAALATGATPQLPATGTTPQLPPGANLAGMGQDWLTQILGPIAGSTPPNPVAAAAGVPGYQTGNMPPGTQFGPPSPFGPVDPSQYPANQAYWGNRTGPTLR